MFVGCTGYIGCRYLLCKGNIVHCEHKELKTTSDSNNFDWNKLLSYLSPDLFNLLAAIVVSTYLSILFDILVLDFERDKEYPSFIKKIIYFINKC